MNNIERGFNEYLKHVTDDLSYIDLIKEYEDRFEIFNTTFGEGSVFYVIDKKTGYYHTEDFLERYCDLCNGIYDPGIKEYTVEEFIEMLKDRAA